MGDSMIYLIVVAVLIGIATIAIGLWILILLYQANKIEERLKCSCGNRAFRHWNDSGEIKLYAYVCPCGVSGFVGSTKEDALVGWELRGNKEAFYKYLTAKHGS